MKSYMTFALLTAMISGIHQNTIAGDRMFERLVSSTVADTTRNRPDRSSVLFSRTFSLGVGGFSPSLARSFVQIPSTPGSETDLEAWRNAFVNYRRYSLGLLIELGYELPIHRLSFGAGGGFAWIQGFETPYFYDDRSGSNAIKERLFGKVLFRPQVLQFSPKAQGVLGSTVRAEWNRTSVWGVDHLRRYLDRSFTSSLLALIGVYSGSELISVGLELELLVFASTKGSWDMIYYDHIPHEVEKWRSSDSFKQFLSPTEIIEEGYLINVISLRLKWHFNFN